MTRFIVAPQFRPHPFALGFGLLRQSERHATDSMGWYFLIRLARNQFWSIPMDEGSP